MVQELFGSVPLVPVTSDADLPSLIHVFDNKGEDLEDIIFIDDKPSRIDLLQRTHIKVLGVKHPYNKDLLEGKRYLTPNYLLEKVHSDGLVGEVKEVEDEQ